ncbi:MAG: hypothetical protein K2Y71_21700 [Xanthobacteraceae bacterium]|nr:hypothetical protein [Xanthobacteraceae bacterium]
MPLKALALGVAALGFVTAANARITEIRIDAVEPFIDGHSFGSVGPYERVKGIAKGELDPSASQNSGIVDLDKAPRNSRGMVEYEVDIFILRPADPAKGSGILYYEVLNRGNKQLGTRLLDVTSGGAVSLANALNNPTTPAHVGNAFVFERGYTVVWSAWDPDVSSANARMTAQFPVAMENGAPMVRRVREEFQVGKRVPADVEVARLNYPAVSTDRAKAQLFVRDRQADQRTEIPADSWEFASPTSVRLLPKGTTFTTAAIYELYYEATQSKVVGIGFAATRDVVSFLRHQKADDKGTASPLSAHGIRHALAFGGSQAGRFLRHYIELGMNKDLAGRKVFDGVYSHTAGAGKVFANHAFAEPGRTVTQHEDHDYPENWFPFSTAFTTDPLVGKTGSLLRGDGSDPLIIETNTSTEYWQKGASLLTTDPTGSRDLSLPANSRVYLIAGTQHGGRAGLGTRPGVCANPTNPHSPAPAMRALVVALEQWVTEGTAPPASRVPSVAAGTAVDQGTLRFPAIKGVTMVRAGNQFGPLRDWNGRPGTMIAATLAGQAFYGTRVAAIDADGNETSGIRLPPIAVPLATYTGWNLYARIPSELCDRDGSYIPFARTKAERAAADDPRPSIEERYGSRANYVAKVRAAADALVRDRLLLPADAAAYGRAAEASDRF